MHCSGTAAMVVHMLVSKVLYVLQQMLLLHASGD
jgi:hypothetical protein